MRQYADSAIVRVGITQLPAGLGIEDLSELGPDLVDPCQNLRMGTKVFAKVLRIVAKWYGSPKGKEVFPQIVEDAVHTWKTGKFEGVNVFQAPDPGNGTMITKAPSDYDEIESSGSPEVPNDEGPDGGENVGSAGMRIDLSRIGGK